MIWKKLVDDQSSPMIHAVAYNTAAGMTEAVLGACTSSVMSESTNRAAKWCYSGPSISEVFVREGNAALDKLRDNPFLNLVDSKSRQTIAALLKTADEIREQDLYSLDGPRLAARFNQLFEEWVEMNVWGHVINVTDFDHFMLTHRINSFLEKRISEKNAGSAVSDAFAALATPLEKTPLALQDRDFFRLLAKIQADPLAREVFRQPTHVIVKQVEEFPEIDRAVHQHAYDYNWLQFHYDGPTALDEEYFIDALAAEVRQGVDAKQKLQEMEAKNEAVARKQKQLEEELGLDAEEKHWIKVARAFMFLKALRKDAVFQASCWTERLLKEIAVRLSLTLLQVRHMTPREINEALLGKPVNSSELDERIRYSCWLHETGKQVQVFTGAKARELCSKIVEEQPVGEVRELRGTPSSPGYAKGTVKLIARIEDIPKMNQGDVLISPATNPNLVPAMKKAAAIVTDEGGITCHAAIISREMGIPCIVGTKIVTKAFKDGDFVEVDAFKGVVRKL